jgi:hypothetical protein
MKQELINETEPGTEVLLPDKLSDCLLLALDDLAKVERQPHKYRVIMRTWHTPGQEYPENPNLCAVCFAGAVMAMTCNMRRHQILGPDDFCEHNEIRFRALNEVRIGLVKSALWRMGHDVSTPEFQVCDYSSGYRDRFSKDILNIVEFLQSRGF